MRRYLIDTMMLGAGLLQRPAAIRLLRLWIDHGEATTSIIVVGELVEHIKGRANFAQNYIDLRELLDCKTLVSDLQHHGALRGHSSAASA